MLKKAYLLFVVGKYNHHNSRFVSQYLLQNSQSLVKFKVFRDNISKMRYIPSVLDDL